MKKLYFLLLIINSQFIIAQNNQMILKGKIQADLSDLGGIHVTNMNSGQVVNTDISGYFNIVAKPRDTLSITSVQLVHKQIVLADHDFDLTGDVMFVKMDLFTNRLKEVDVTEFQGINAESLRIVPKGQKKYTSAERKLKTSSSGVLSFINFFSGSTKRSKKMVALERKEIQLEKFSYLFDDSFYKDKLNIPKDEIKKFQYYAIENDDFFYALYNNDQKMINFLIYNLAIMYNDVKEEK